MSVHPAADTTPPSYGDLPDEPPGLRGDDGDDVEGLPNRLLWLGILGIVVITTGGAAAVVAIFRDPSLGVPVTVAVTAAAVTVLGAVLLWAIPAVRGAREHAEALLRGQLRTATARDHADDAAAAMASDDYHLATAGSARTPWQEYPLDSRTDSPNGSLDHGPSWSRGDHEPGALPDDSRVRLILAKLSRRLQGYITRGIDEIDKLEKANDDPELLAGLYTVDRLFTLAHRQTENLAVLGGQSLDRRSTEPVDVHQVLLGAISEVERFDRVDLIPVNVPGAPGPLVPKIQGLVVTQIAHLLAELLENATQFTPPDRPKVDIRANLVSAGVAIEISDRGVGIGFDELQAINRILDGTDQIDAAQLVQEGRIGLSVVRDLAMRHDIKVALQKNIHGGVVATVVIPPQWLCDPEPELGSGPTTAPAPSVLPPRRRRRLEAAPGPQSPQPLPQRPASHAAPDHTPDHTRGEPAHHAAAPPAPVLPPLAPPASSPHADPEHAHTTYAATQAAALAAAATPAGTRDNDASHDQRNGGNADSSTNGDRRDTGRSSTHGTLHDPLHDPLPVRDPGRDYAHLASNTHSFEPVQQPGTPPPLPVRGEGSHMPPELWDSPAGPALMPGHNPNLFADTRAGRERSVSLDTGGPETTGPDTDPPHTRTQDSTTRGDHTRWPTT